MSNTIIQEPKVFCTNCAYFNACKKSNARMQFDDNSIHDTCNAPQNIRSTYMSDGSDKYISSPSIINKYNNCGWFLNKAHPGDVIHVVNMHNKNPDSHPHILNEIRKVREEISEVEATADYKLRQHLEDFGNPHQVTKAQVGLGNVDNTADIDKPVSNAVQEQVDRLDNSIVAETTRATTEEARLHQLILDCGGSVAAETERALAAEAELDDRIDSNQAAISSESARAMSVENALMSNVSALQTGLLSANQNIALNAEAISLETSRARTKETEIEQAINDLTTKTEGDIERAKVECKEFAQSEDQAVRNYAITVATDKRTEAVHDAKIYTDTVKSQLQAEIEEKTSTLWEYKGKVNYRRDLDSIVEKRVGDIYTVLYRDDNTSWNCEFIWTKLGEWQELGGIIDLRNYYTKPESDGLLSDLKDYTDNEFAEVRSELFDAKSEAINAAEAKDEVRYVKVTEDIATAKAQAIAEAEAKDVSRYQQVTLDIATAKAQAIDAAEAKDVTRYQQVTNDINLAKVESIADAHNYTDEKIVTVTGNISAHLADTNPHNINALLASTLQESKDFTVEKATELDNRVTHDYNAKIDDVRNTYLPLSGEKIVTGKVEFQKTIAVKDSVTGADTVTFDTKKMVKTNNAGAPDIVIEYPSASGILARTSEVDVAKNEAITEAETKDSARYTQVTKDISDAKNEAIQSAEDKDEVRYQQVTIDIESAKAEVKQYAEDKDREEYEAVTRDIALAKDQSTHYADEEIAAAKAEVKKYSDDKDVELHGVITSEIDAKDNQLHATITSETDSKVKEVKDTYLPLSGERAVSGKVEFQKTITVKDSVEGAISATITATNITQKDSGTGGVDKVFSFPPASGTLARVSDVTTLGDSVTAKLDNHNGRIEALEDAVPTSITGVISSTSVSDGKDVPNNFAVNNALNLKANQTDLISGLNTKANQATTYTKAEVDNLVEVKANQSDVNDSLALKADKVALEALTDVAATKDTTYTRDVIDAELAKKANNSYVNEQLLLKADKSTTYTKNDVDAKVVVKADQSYVDSTFETKHNAETTYATKTEVNNGLSAKANQADVTLALLGKVNTGLTTLAEYGITDAYTKEEVNSKIAGAYKVKPSVETVADLPVSGNEIGDVRNVRSGENAGANFVWTTDGWDMLAPIVDISGKQDVTTAVKHAYNTAVGSINVPVHVLPNGEVSAINIATATEENDPKLITSGAVYSALTSKVNNSDFVSQLATKANVGDAYIKSETDALLSVKANSSDVNAALDTKANVSDVYNKTETDDLLLTKSDKTSVYTIAQVDDKLATKANADNVYTKIESDSLLSTKANANETYNKSQVDDAINTAKLAAISEANAYAHAQDDIVKVEAATTAHGYADVAKREAYEAAQSYTDSQIATVKNKHYDIKTIEAEESDANAFKALDWASNNIDLTGKTGDVYIYLPAITTALGGKARELIVNVSGRNVDTCKVYIASLNDEVVSFKDGGMLETIKDSKESFSIKFVEYDHSKFLVDEVGVGDTTNNAKISIVNNQVTIIDGNTGSAYKFVVKDGFISLEPAV